MTKLEWSSADEAWVANLTDSHFEDLEIRVLTDGDSTQPTEAQLKAVDLIEQIAKKGLPSTKKLARKYAMEYLGPDEVEDMDDEELAIEIHAAVVPRLREADSTYIILVGNSDIDMEHGVAILCKDGTKTVSGRHSPPSTPARLGKTSTWRSHWKPRSVKVGPWSKQPRSTTASSRSAPNSTVSNATARQPRSFSRAGWGGSARSRYGIT